MLAGEDRPRCDATDAVPPVQRRRAEDRRAGRDHPATGRRRRQQDPIDGISFADAFNDPDVPDRLITEYFEVMGSRAIYHDGWIAAATGHGSPAPLPASPTGRPTRTPRPGRRHLRSRPRARRGRLRRTGATPANGVTIRPVVSQMECDRSRGQRLAVPQQLL